MPTKIDDSDSRPVRLTLYITEDENWVIEGIVRDRKRKDRGYSKNEYFRELMRKDPAFVTVAAEPKKK